MGVDDCSEEELGFYSAYAPLKGLNAGMSPPNPLAYVWTPCCREDNDA
jgi:hypothetical protein